MEKVKTKVFHFPILWIDKKTRREIMEELEGLLNEILIAVIEWLRSFLLDILCDLGVCGG